MNGAVASDVAQEGRPTSAAATAAATGSPLASENTETPGKSSGEAQVTEDTGEALHADSLVSLVANSKVFFERMPGGNAGSLGSAISGKIHRLDGFAEDVHRVATSGK